VNSVLLVVEPRGDHLAAAGLGSQMASREPSCQRLWSFNKVSVNLQDRLDLLRVSDDGSFAGS
jgi:hypothetical protein